MQQFVYTDRQAQGAIPNGSRVIKVDGDASDRDDLGKLGIVLGSLDVSLFRANGSEYLHPPSKPTADVQFLYFVEWDQLPGIPVAVVDWKIKGAPS